MTTREVLGLNWRLYVFVGVTIGGVLGLEMVVVDRGGDWRGSEIWS